jgi:(E)-4-hydroxy-3-methylbut-2-enyl-diphosphate synthase
MTRQVLVGNVPIGGGAPVSIQSMCNIPLADFENIKKQALELQDAGCQILRVTVPSPNDAENFGRLKRELNIPLVADIHFDYKAALAAVSAGADKIRINPGNMEKDKIRLVTSACRSAGIPIRVGVNSGSVEKSLLAKYGGRTAQALCESAKNSVNLLLNEGFTNIVVSMKASSVKMTVDAYRLFANDIELNFKEGRFPLHIGVTEAGTLRGGIIKSAVGIGSLLLDGIGDTLRVSLTAPPVEEIYAANNILKAVGLKDDGIDLISCPTCGRTTADTQTLANYIENNFSHIKKPLKIAVMGCVVNGPGEASDADLGVTGVNGKYVLFRKGNLYKKDISEEDIFDVITKEIELLSK